MAEPCIHCPLTKISLVRCPRDAVDAYALSLEVAWGTALALIADVLAMLLHQYQHTLVDVAVLIEETLKPIMLRQMRLFYHHTGEG